MKSGSLSLPLTPEIANGVLVHLMEWLIHRIVCVYLRDAPGPSVSSRDTKPAVCSEPRWITMVSGGVNVSVASSRISLTRLRVWNVNRRVASWARSCRSGICNGKTVGLEGLASSLLFSESVYLAASPWGHRACRATGPSVLAKRWRCDYDITYCTSSKRHHFWERLTRAPRRGKCRGSFALPVTGSGYGKSLILCVLTVISWVHMRVFLVLSVYLCLRTVIIFVCACVWSK